MSAQRIAVVTGSNKGIGFATVRALCKKFDGAVYLTAIDKTSGKTAVKVLESEGLKPKFHQLDINDRQSVDTMKKYFVREYGRVDIFVHNAAIAFKVADPTPIAVQARKTIAVNFTSALYLCNAFLPTMNANGRITILSSASAVSSFSKCSNDLQEFFRSPNLTEEKLVEKIGEFVEATQTDNHGKVGFSDSPYGMSKLGLTAFTRILAKRAVHLEQPNVLVNCCDPGYVNTDMSSHKGPKTPDQGAETPVFLALLPKYAKEPNGEFFSNNKVFRWYE